MEKPYYEFIEAEAGIHQIGGKKPEEFEYPDNEFISNFQYIGLINNRDRWLSWLPFKLHLICPIYLNINAVFLDYSNASQPKIISPKDTSRIDSEHLFLTVDSYIEFESRKVNLVKKRKIDDMECIGVAVNPFDAQDIPIPKCPKTGDEMKFVCQLMTFGEVPVKEKNFESDEEYLEHMNFWCDGSLFVFCEPNSKTVCYFIQST